MLVRFLCPSGHQLIARPDMFGENAQCPVCFQRIVVPIRNPRASGRHKKKWDAEDALEDDATAPASPSVEVATAAPDFVPTDAFVPVPEPVAAARSEGRNTPAPGGSTSYFPPLPTGLGTAAPNAPQPTTTSHGAAVMNPPETKPAPAPAWKPAPLRLAPGAAEPPAPANRAESKAPSPSSKKPKQPKEPRASTVVAPRAPLMPPGANPAPSTVAPSAPLPAPTPPSAYAPPPAEADSEAPTLDLPAPPGKLGLQIHDAPPPAPPSKFYEPPRSPVLAATPPVAAAPPAPSPDVPLPLPPSAFAETAHSAPAVPEVASPPVAPAPLTLSEPAEAELARTSFFQEAKVEAGQAARVAPLLQDAPPPASVAFEPTSSQRLSGAVTALALLIAGVVMLWPALSIYTAEGATPGWAKVVMVIFGVQVLYSLLLAALPDWSVFWLGMIWQTLVAAVHALAWAVLSFGPKEGPLTFHLETVRADGPGWCIALTLAALAGALVCRKFCRSGRIAFEQEKADLERRRAALQRA